MVALRSLQDLLLVASCLFLGLLPIRSASETPRLSIGGSGWALRFDGVDDLVALYAEMPPPPHTIEMWIKPIDLFDGSGARLVRFRDNAPVISQASFENARNLFALSYNGNQVWFPDSTLLGIATADGTPLSEANGLLYHYAYVRDGRNVSIFVDGEKVSEGSLNSADERFYPEPLPWLLGARWSSSRGALQTDDRNFGGIIDEVRWWRVARSQSELRNASLVQVPDDDLALAMQWRFDNGQGLGTDTFSLGAQDPTRAPVWVPSLVGGSGGPVAVSLTAGAPPQEIELCAILLPASQGAVLTAAFVENATLGVLSDAAPAKIEMHPASALPHVDGQRYCATTLYSPVSAGREEIEFEVTALLSSGEVVSGSQVLAVSIAPNRPPSAGVSRGVYTNGFDSYVSLGSWDLAEHFSFAMWVDPVAVRDSAFLLSRHLGSGSNIFIFGWQAGKYEFRVDCRAGCMNPDGSTPIGRLYLPEGADEDLVLDTGWTVRDVKEARGRMQHLGATFQCHFRGDASNPPRATLTLYLNGQAIGHSDEFPACLTSPTNEAAYDSWQTRPTPWELGQEYDGADEIGEHLPGVKVKPSDFAEAVFDEVVFWNRSLSAAEMLEVSRGNLPKEADQVVHYTFDLDDPAACAERQLWQRSLQCYGVNEALGRTAPTSIFPWTNAHINGAEVVKSPFHLVPGSPVYKVLLSGTCANITLQGSDPDGDALTFYPFLNKTGIEYFRSAGPSGQVLEFCDIHDVGRREVVVQFNACDPLGFCSLPYASGLGRAVFQILPPGPAIISFQALPAAGKLRIVFDMSTNTPAVDNEEEVGRFISLDPHQRLLFGAWEAGGRILQLILEDSGWLARGGKLPELSITVPESGGLRDAGLERYPSLAFYSGLVDKTCTNGTVLTDGVEDCVPCPAGFVPKVEGTEAVCQACGVGEYAAGTFCELCAPGTWSNSAGASACMPCRDGKTTPRGARSADECRCPAGTFDRPTRVDGNLTTLCAPCGEGLTCPGMGQVFLLEGFSATDAAEVFRCHQDVKYCPGGPMGTCARGRSGVGCSLCLEGKIPSSDGTCKDCDDTNILPSVMLVAVVLACLGLLYVRIDRENASTQSRSLLLVGIACQQLITCFQMFSVTAQIRVDWHDPIKSIFRLMQVMTVDVDLINVNCVGTFSPLIKYISRLSFVGAAVAVVVLYHVICVLLLHRGQFRERMSSLVGVIGSVFMMFYISILSTILLSMQCDENPNGKWTVNAYPTILCWEGGDHVPMVVVALIALGIPLMFLMKCAEVVWVVPQRVQRMDLEFLRAYSFLFLRFRAETRWYAIVFLLRSALIAVIPIMTHLEWVVLILQLVMIASIAITSFFRPWRIAASAAIDIAASVAMVIILTLVGFQGSRSDDGQLLATLATICFILVLVGIAAAVGIGTYTWALSHCRKTYQFFICHHKEHAGAMARLLKLVLTENTAATRKVFLDADDLAHLDTLFDFVRDHCETLMVLCSSRIMTRPWCVGEIATAYVNKVKTLPVIYSGFSRPEEEWIAQVAERVSFDSLLDFGISVDSVQGALRAFRGLPHLDMPDVLTQGAVVMLQKQILRGAPLPTDTPELSIHAGGNAEVLVGADSRNLEALAAARVLSKLMLTSSSAMPHLAPVMLLDLEAAHASSNSEPHGHALPHEAKSYVMLCTSGCFNSVPFLVNLVAVVTHELKTVPVVACSAFRFPTPIFYEELHTTIELNGKLTKTVSPDAVVDYVSRIFKRIAIVFTPHVSLALIHAQAAEVFQQLSRRDLQGLSHGVCGHASTLSHTPVGPVSSPSEECSVATLAAEASEAAMFDTTMDV